MASFNCFKDCMNCNGDSQSEEHPFKLKKERKFLTLTKKGPKKEILHPNMMTFSSVMTEPSKVCETQHQRLSKIVKEPRKIREYSSLQYKDYSLQKKIPSKITQNNHPTIVFGKAQRQVRSIDDRQRRYSIGKTPKPNFIYCNSNFSGSKEPFKGSHQLHLRQGAIIKRAEILTGEPLYKMNEIKEVSQQRQKSSSLFQGARSIVSRMVTSRKKEQILTTLQQEDNSQKNQMKMFYDSARLCQTENAIVNTHSSLAEQEQQKKIKSQFHRISLDSIPLSPQTKARGNYGHFQVGRLIGVGKWAHLYLCQQKETHAVFVVKEIFKQILEISCSIEQFKTEMRKLSSLSHSSLMSLYGIFQTTDKLCLILEYCSRCLFDELRDKGPLPLTRVRQLSEELIKAVIYMHDNEIVHGNVNIFQAFDCFGECKLKHSLTRSISSDKWSENTYKRDIEGLAITIFELAYGEIPLSKGPANSLYEKQKLYSDQVSRKKYLEYVNDRLSAPEKDESYDQLNQVLSILLNWDEQCRLTSSLCLDHPFFQLKKLQ